MLNNRDGWGSVAGKRGRGAMLVAFRLRLVRSDIKSKVFYKFGTSIWMIDHNYLCLRQTTTHTLKVAHKKLYALFALKSLRLKKSAHGCESVVIRFTIGI